MTILERLRAIVEAVPSGGSVTIPRDWLAAELEPLLPAPVSDDLTIAQVALRLGRAPTTIRGWCERGELRGAYRFRAREWRIPPAALEAFLASERANDRTQRERASLSDWRQARPSTNVEPDHS